MRKLCRRMATAALGLLLLGAAGLYLLNRALPDAFIIQPNQQLSIASMPWLTADSPRQPTEAPVNASARDTGGSQTLRLFGLIPVKTVQTVTEAQRYVIVCGTPFGVKMFSNGALVVAFSDLYTDLGSENPAKEAGLRLGDLIVSAGGHTVRNNEELSSAIATAGGNAMEVVYLRDGNGCTLSVINTNYIY